MSSWSMVLYTRTRGAQSPQGHSWRVDQRCTAEAGWSDLTPSDAPETMAGYPAPEPMERARWFWKEDACNLSAHNPADVKGEFVAYAGQVCAELDEKWHAYKLGGAAVVALRIDGVGPAEAERFVRLCTRAGGGDATPLSKGKLKTACKSVRSKASGAPPLDLATVESMQRKVLECYRVPTDEASGGANTGASASGDRRR